VIPFGWGCTARQIESLTKSRVVLRERDGAPFKTETGNLIVDVQVARIDQPLELEIALNHIPGVIETGLFVGRTDILIVGTPDGIETHNVKRA
jgi:ribose 5-phosphate isomerase A